MDTESGALSYLASTTSPPDTFTLGALVTDFLHLGQGTSISVPIPGSPNFANVGTGMSSSPLLLSPPSLSLLREGMSGDEK